jgi:hypothetical protein
VQLVGCITVSVSVWVRVHESFDYDVSISSVGLDDLRSTVLHRSVPKYLLCIKSLKRLMFYVQREGVHVILGDMDAHPYQTVEKSKQHFLLSLAQVIKSNKNWF